MKKVFLLINFFLCGLFGSLAAQSTDDLDLSSLIQPVDTNSFIRDPMYYSWCNSFIKGEDGMYHLFYSRWPKSIGFTGWLTHSEIAHAVSSRLEGPYQFKEVVIKGRPGKWDAITTHNAQIRKFGDKYYLYYTSTNTGDEVWSAEFLKEVGRVGYGHGKWEVLRSNQRAGVASAPSLNGPWTRMDSPLVQPAGPIKNVAVNPSVCQGGKDKFILIIKGDDVTTEKRKLIQAVGTGNTPCGPFRLENKPAFDDVPTEDVCVWYDEVRARYYAIFHAHGGNFIGLITSEDGTNWQKAKHYRVCLKQIPLKDGTVMKVSNMERPFVYLENGKPVMLSFAVKKGNDSFIVTFRGKTDVS